jgi:calcium-dependent protein kinase
MNILKEIDHPNIVKLYELYQDDNNYYLITEFLEGGELFDRIQQFKTFNEATAGKLMRQVMSAIAYCHSRNIVHRDLKPENIIFIAQDRMDIKVIDFGTSRKLVKDQQMTKRLGTVPPLIII